MCMIISISMFIRMFIIINDMIVILLFFIHISRLQSHGYGQFRTR